MEGGFLKRFLLLLCLVAAVDTLPAQDLDPATAWATIASYQFRVFPNPELHPLESPGLVYYRAGNIDLKVGVITPGPETVVRPTVLYIHGGGWVHYTKDNMIFALLPYLARGMDVVNVLRLRWKTAAALFIGYSNTRRNMASIPNGWWWRGDRPGAILL